jgi:hypothetical protein
MAQGINPEDSSADATIRTGHPAFWSDRVLYWFPLGLIVGSVAIIVATTAITLVVIGGGSDTTIDVSMTAPASVPKSSSGADCVTANGFTDIARGMRVTITDETGTVLAIGSLGPAFWVQDNRCGFDFSVTVPPGKSIYRFSSEHHGSIEYTAADLKAMHNKVGLDVS